jgi:hypothetical protein
VCQDDLGSSLQPGSETFWCRKYSGSTAKTFLLAEASTRCSQVHQILHFLCHFQALHQETWAIHPSSYSDRPWESISMDYMSGLPSTKHGNDCVFMVIDRFSKMEILAPCKKSITTEATAKIFFTHVWVHFGLPQTIISDQDSRFLSTFWSILWLMMDTKLTKSTTFHPQTDGQTEVVNMMIVHILRMYNSKHPHTWDEILPYVQHSYNISLHNSIGHNPFQVCLGFQPLAPIDVALPIASHRKSPPMPRLRLIRQPN